MKFKRELHNQIFIILQSLNSNLLDQNSAYFGGGTLIALNWGEYRQSKDIDFICSVTRHGYRRLRSAIYDGGYEVLFNDLNQVQIGRSTTDQYGIRMLVMVNNVPIKTEIIAEVRFQLDPPQYLEWCPVPCLSSTDCFASKLLANSDRYMDRNVQARDLIDLAILRLQSPIPDSAIDKAENAYEVVRPLQDALRQFQQQPDWRETCFSGLGIRRSQLPRIIDGIDFLAEDFNLESTTRTFYEQHDYFDFD